MLEHHPNRPLSYFQRILVLIFHDSILSQIEVSGNTGAVQLLSYIDLDGMKTINDTLGHKKGDEALVEASQILKEVFRESDIIARVGGDEFAVLVLETKTVSAKLIAERLEHHIDLHNAAEHRDYKISMSIGIVDYNFKTPLSLDEWLSEADECMYEQKRIKKVRNATIPLNKKPVGQI